MGVTDPSVLRSRVCGVGVCLPGAGGGVRAAAARAECDIRAAWAGVVGVTLQGLEDNSVIGVRLRRSSLDGVCRDNPPPSMLCLLERAASVRPHAYARGRGCACARA